MKNAENVRSCLQRDSTECEGYAGAQSVVQPGNEETAGRSQKRPPLVRSCHAALRFLVQLRQGFISYLNRLPLLFLFFFRSFQFCAVILIRVILIAQGEQQQPDGISGLLRVHP